MKFRLYLFFIISIFIQTHLSSQQTSRYPLVLRVIDKRTSTPIEGAEILIKEIGFQVHKTNFDGIVSVISVPVGEINYRVSKEGYISTTGQINITTETKSNTREIEITKLPVGPAESIIIYGDIIDNHGRKVIDAEVQVDIADLKKKTISDNTGYFSIEIDFSELRYLVPEFRLNVTKDECRRSARYTIPKNPVYDVGNFSMDCYEVPGGPQRPDSTSTPNNPPKQINTLGLNCSAGSTLWTAHLNTEWHIIRELILTAKIASSSYRELDIVINNEKQDKKFFNIGVGIGIGYFFFDASKGLYLDLGINFCYSLLRKEIAGLSNFRSSSQNLFSIEPYSRISWRFPIYDQLFLDPNLGIIIYPSYSSSSHVVGGLTVSARL